MMNAFRPWETLLLLVTSSAGLTREALAIVTTSTCPNGRISCPGYGDDSANKYCCPSSIQQGGYYCCNYWEKEMSNSNYSENIPEIIGGVIGAIFLLASIAVLSCFFCTCCYVYKYRRRKRNGSEPAARRPSSALGWRYRNWPRSNFLPSASASCNGNSSSANNRYYYSSRSCRDAAGSGSSSRHHAQYYHHSSYAWPSPRHRHELRVQPEHPGTMPNCCYRENDGLGYGARTSSTYSTYLYEPIHAVLTEAKPFEAPPPYPIAQYYPTYPPITISEHQISRTAPPAVSPGSISTSTTVIHDDFLRSSTTTESDLGGIGNCQPLLVLNSNSTNDAPGQNGFVTCTGYSPKPS